MKKKLSEKDAPKFIVVKECGKKVIYEQLEIKYPPKILKNRKKQIYTDRFILVKTAAQLLPRHYIQAMWRKREVYLWNGLTTGGSLLNIRS